nr:hypothetical protein [Tanacetum cinerariifolium]
MIEMVGTSIFRVRMLPTLYQQLKDVNVRRWPSLYATQATYKVDKKSYSIIGFAWAFKGQLPIERLVPDEIEARSRWFMEDTRVGLVPQANKDPIISDQHYGISDFSEFQSNRGVVSSFHTWANNNSFFNMAMPSNWQTPIESNCQTSSNLQIPNPSYLGTPNSQPPIPSFPCISNWQNLMTSYSLNFPPPFPSHRHDAGLLNPNIYDRARREHHPSIYKQTLYGFASYYSVT